MNAAPPDFTSLYSPRFNSNPKSTAHPPAPILFHRSLRSHSIPTTKPAAPRAQALAFASPVALGAAPALLEDDVIVLVTPMLPAATTGLAPPPDAPPSPPASPPAVATLDVAAVEAELVAVELEPA